MDPRFAPDNGRPFPAYTPRRASCPHCGSPLEIKDERSRLVVCSSCGTHLEMDGSLGEVELKMLGQGASARQYGFLLDIGDSFRHDKLRYEVIGRIATEDAEWPGSPTLEYLLFHPRRGTLWLSSYEGLWDLTSTSRVQPVTFARGLAGKGDKLETHDGRSWSLIEQGTKVISYVDGALPWLAKVGEKSSYVELMDSAGNGEIYEVEFRRVDGGNRHEEQEIGRGKWLTVQEVRDATGKEIPKPQGKRENVAVIQASYRWLLKVASFIFICTLVLFVATFGMGKGVLTQTLNQDDLQGEVLSQPFEVASDGNVIKVSFKAPLSNAWMSIDWGVVQGDDKVIHVDDKDLEYYQGVEGGERWTEGSRSTSTYLKIDQAGTYRLLIRALSASGNSVEAKPSHVPLKIRVKDGARQPIFMGLALFGNIVALIICFALYRKWKQGDEEDD